jgi:hypothetical protein
LITKFYSVPAQLRARPGLLKSSCALDGNDFEDLTDSEDENRLEMESLSVVDLTDDTFPEVSGIVEFYVGHFKF